MNALSIIYEEAIETVYKTLEENPLININRSSDDVIAIGICMHYADRWGGQFPHTHSKSTFFIRGTEEDKETKAFLRSAEYYKLITSMEMSLRTFNATVDRTADSTFCQWIETINYISITAEHIKTTEIKKSIFSPDIKQSEEATYRWEDPSTTPHLIQETIKEMVQAHNKIRAHHQKLINTRQHAKLFSHLMPSTIKYKVIDEVTTHK